MIDHYAIMKEFGDILHSRHPGWSARGDCRDNAGAFLRRIRDDMPGEAVSLADDILSCPEDFALLCDFSPLTAKMAARVLLNMATDI